MKINGERRYLWRAVDLESEVLESVMTKRPATKAALKSLPEISSQPPTVQGYGHGARYPIS